MKKTISILLVVGTMLLVVGCGTTTETYTTTTASTYTTWEESDDATTDSAMDDTLSGAVWEMNYYVDEFNQETDQWYVGNTSLFTGSFSNSATTDSSVTANVLIDASDVSIILYEYGHNQVKNPYSDNCWYDITLMAEDGSKHTLEGAMPASNGDRIYITENKSALLSRLKKGEDVKLYIVESESPTTTYLLDIKGANLGDLLK